MSKACTIYTRRNYQDVYDYLVEEAFHDVSDDVTTFERSYFEGNIRISLKQEVERGDDFSKLLMGTWNYFEQIETKHTDQKSALTKRILETETAIGIVAEPEFEEEDKRLDLIFRLTDMFDGIIFNGSGMLDKEGQVILDSDGDSEV